MTHVAFYDWRTVLAAIAGGLGGCLSSAGGIGGGGLFVPIFNLLLQFDPKTSAALSNVTILGGNLANVPWYILQKHPHFPHKPLIDYDVALLLQPNMLLGISLGVLCNYMLPSWLITLLFVLALSAMTFRSCKCSFQLWKHESLSVEPKLKILAEEEQNAAEAKLTILIHETHSTNCFVFSDTQQSNVLAEQAQKGVLSEPNASINPSLYPDQCNAIEPKLNNGFVFPHTQLQLSLTHESKVLASQGLLHSQQEPKGTLSEPLLEVESHNNSQFPCSKLAILALVWLSFFTIQLIHGTKDGKSIFNWEACGTGYWFTTILQLPLALIFTLGPFCHLQLHAPEDPLLMERRENLHVPWAAVSWRSFYTLPIMAFMGGIIGGMLGIGGGMVINPLLLEIGVPPQVTAATCAFMVLFSSSMSVVQFWLLGRIPVKYALCSASLSFIASVAGLHIAQKVIKRYGRISVIVYSVSSVMGISAILMASFGSMDVWRQVQRGEYMGFHAIC